MIFIFYEQGERYETDHNVKEFAGFSSAELWINEQFRALAGTDSVFRVLKIVEGKTLEMQIVERVQEIKIRRD